MRFTSILTGFSALVLGQVLASRLLSNASLSPAAQDLFDYSMAVQDLRYDPYYNFIQYSDHGSWSVRFTAWYTIGLLKRNQGDDVLHAKAAIRNVLACQYTKDFDAAWYGTFKVSPDQPDPTPDSELFPPMIYETYDPNWREFIGTTLIQAVEEFSPLLGPSLISAIETSLTAAALGSMRRNGTHPAGDNLTPSYSNPAYMRALVVAWLGHRLSNSTFTSYATHQAHTLLSLFTRPGASPTLSEYNSPAYYGIDLFALAATLKYTPRASPIHATAATVLPALWSDIAAHYNPALRNLAGPYDRAYSRDASTRSQTLSLWFWALFGRSPTGPHPPKGEADLLFDIAQGAQIALVAAVAARHLPQEAAAQLRLTSFDDGPDRLLTRSIWSDLAPTARPRVATSWISAPLMAGALRGVAEPAPRDDQFVPAIVHWAADAGRRVAWISLYPTAGTVEAEAGVGWLRVRYPEAGRGVFTFAVGGLPPGGAVEGLEGLPCLGVRVEAEGLERRPTVYGAQLRGHYFYNVTYVVPEGFEGVPEVLLRLEYTC